MFKVTRHGIAAEFNAPEHSDKSKEWRLHSTHFTSFTSERTFLIALWQDGPKPTVAVQPTPPTKFVWVASFENKSDLDGEMTAFDASDLCKAHKVNAALSDSMGKVVATISSNGEIMWYTDALEAP